MRLAVLCLLPLLTLYVLHEFPEAFGGDPPEWKKSSLQRSFPNPDASAKAGAYVGVEDCSMCHEERAKSLAGSFHAALLTRPASRGCEECHGPGARHAEEEGDAPIRNNRKAPAKQVVAVCLKCHTSVLSKPSRGHRDWLRAAGSKEKVRSCVDCHDVHLDRKSKAFDPKLGPFRELAPLEKHATHVKAARCRECHPDHHPDLLKSGHAGILESTKACGTCHGAGSLHADSGGHRSKIVFPWKQKRKDLNRNCRSCHAESQAPATATCLSHDANGLSCITCHDANAKKGATLRHSQLLLCGTCHEEEAERFELPSRHSASQGGVACTDCHNPLDRPKKKSKASPRHRACVECHREGGDAKRHEHDAAKGKGCVDCHDPHGSNRDALLRKSTGD
jgi:DmsE family decaheme c-type cytochrome